MSNVIIIFVVTQGHCRRDLWLVNNSHSECWIVKRSLQFYHPQLGQYSKNTHNEVVGWQHSSNQICWMISFHYDKCSHEIFPRLWSPPKLCRTFVRFPGSLSNIPSIFSCLVRSTPFNLNFLWTCANVSLDFSELVKSLFVERCFLKWEMSFLWWCCIQLAKASKWYPVPRLASLCSDNWCIHIYTHIYTD